LIDVNYFCRSCCKLSLITRSLPLKYTQEVRILALVSKFSSVCATVPARTTLGVGSMYSDVVAFRDVGWGTPGALPPPADRPVGLNGRFEIADGLFIVRIGGEMTRRISRGVNAGATEDGVPETYTFVRERESDDGVWDADGRLRLAIALSRLIHPTSVGLEQSAVLTGRITDDPARITVIPGPVSGPAAAAYITDADQRNWLTEEDATQLRELLVAYDARQLPPRVRRALWFHEFAACTLDGAVRWALFVTGIESLINVAFDKIAKQFTVRSVGLANECKVPFSKRQATRTYSMRSRVDHGSATSLPGDELDLLVATEHVLRAAIRRAILDGLFADLFLHDATIEQRWPVPLTIAERLRRIRMTLQRVFRRTARRLR